MNRIPKRLHFIYKSRELPKSYSENLGRIRELHPGWDWRVYGDEEAAALMSRCFPQLWNMYRGYPYDVQRTDIFRLALLYLYGGFYMDLDMLCFLRLDPLCGSGVVLGEEKTITGEECSQLGLQHGLRIANYMFGSVPYHPFWHAVIKEAVVRSALPVKREEDVLHTTGPGLLTDVYHAAADAYPDITLLRNTDRMCRRACGRISCHFGDYAAHLHQGSWRWEHAAVAGEAGA